MFGLRPERTVVAAVDLVTVIACHPAAGGGSTGQLVGEECGFDAGSQLPQLELAYADLRAFPASVCGPAHCNWRLFVERHFVHWVVAEMVENCGHPVVVVVTDVALLVDREHVAAFGDRQLAPESVHGHFQVD